MNKLIVDENDYSGLITDTTVHKSTWFFALKDSKTSLELMEYIRSGEVGEQYEVHIHTDMYKIDAAARIQTTLYGIAVTPIFE